MIKKVIFLVGLVFCVGSGSAQPSKDEFNLFCRILAWTDDMLLEPEFVYDKENVDRETIKEMRDLYQSTTDNMNDFRRLLWERKDFLKEHPPPTQLESREQAHREIGQLIRKAEKITQDNRKITVEANKKMEEAKLTVLRGLYGEKVHRLQNTVMNMDTIQNDMSSVFVNSTSATASCGSGGQPAGKTLFNDLFCVCVGEGVEESFGPCHGDIMAPKRKVIANNHCCKKECCGQDCCKNNNCCPSGCQGSCQEGKCCCCNCCAKWTQMKYPKSSIPPYPFAQSIQKIEMQCRKELDGRQQTEKIPDLLKEYMGMIGKGSNETATKRKIFGHSGRKNKSHVTECTGAGSNETEDPTGHHNANICVDYNETLKDGKEIPWHTQFREASEEMDQAKGLQDQILKNRAALVLLKNQAWAAYNREKDDETSNLDDMNASHLLDGTQLLPSFPFLFLLPFMIL